MRIVADANGTIETRIVEKIERNPKRGIGMAIGTRRRVIADERRRGIAIAKGAVAAEITTTAIRKTIEGTAKVPRGESAAGETTTVTATTARTTTENGPNESERKSPSHRPSPAESTTRRTRNPNPTNPSYFPWENRLVGLPTPKLMRNRIISATTTSFGYTSFGRKEFALTIWTPKRRGRPLQDLPRTTILANWKSAFAKEIGLGRKRGE